MDQKLSKQELAKRRRIVVTQYGGILPYCEAFYIQSIIYAADRSSLAFERYKVAVAEQMDAASIVATVQEALTHAAALSRFFWPSKSKDDPLADARGKALRAAFKLDDTSALKWRKLRNAIEHFDEDLDRFLLGDHVGAFFPAPLVDSHKLADEVIGHIFKLVDPEEEIFVLLGHKYEFAPIREAVFKIYEDAVRMDEQGGRLKPLSP
jgi:hypothetical protein